MHLPIALVGEYTVDWAFKQPDNFPAYESAQHPAVIPTPLSVDLWNTHVRPVIRLSTLAVLTV